MGRAGYFIQYVIFPTLMLMTIWDRIQFFVSLNGEPLQENWLWFKKLVLQCLTQRLPDNLLLSYFYMILELVNKCVADQVSPRGLMQQYHSL